MTVAEVLAAHASAQITAAKTADEARRLVDESSLVVLEEAASFVVSWRCEATVIGSGRSGA